MISGDGHSRIEADLFIGPISLLPIAVDDHVETLDALVFFIERFTHSSFILNKLLLMLSLELLYPGLKLNAGVFPLLFLLVSIEVLPQGGIVVLILFQ